MASSTFGVRHPLHVRMLLTILTRRSDSFCTLTSVPLLMQQWKAMHMVAFTQYMLNDN